jgi:hypothetical protein
MQLLFSGAIPGRADERGVAALLGIFDAESGRVVHRCEYTPPVSLHVTGQKVQFTGFSLAEERLFVCSFGEILVFDSWPPTRPAGRITHPGFNDLHHCLPWGEGLAVANTGLETVDLVSLEGELLERWDLLAGEADARRIDERTDYRRILDTKPHRRHVNHLFSVESALWATQLRSADAICLDDPGRRLEMGVGMPHDGRWVGEHLVFTTTNGRVVFADPARCEVEQSVDLARLTPGLQQLGWCRGICADPRCEQRLFVGFSTLRRSAWKEFGYWIRWRQALAPSRLALYDLAAGAQVDAWRLGGAPGYVLFQLDPLLAERLL